MIKQHLLTSIATYLAIIIVGALCLWLSANSNRNIAATDSITDVYAANTTSTIDLSQDYDISAAKAIKQSDGTIQYYIGTPNGTWKQVDESYFKTDSYENGE